MHESQKKQRLTQAIQHLKNIRERIACAVTDTKKREDVLATALRSSEGGDKMVQQTLMAYNRQRVEDLEHLYPSPYFAACDFASEGERKKISLLIISLKEKGAAGLLFYCLLFVQLHQLAK